MGGGGLSCRPLSFVSETLLKMLTSRDYCKSWQFFYLYCVYFTHFAKYAVVDLGEDLLLCTLFLLGMKFRSIAYN